MPDSPILLFDVMDTLVYNPFNSEIPAFFGLSQDELLRQNDPSAWDRFERGQISERDYLKSYFRDGRSFDHESFRRTVDAAYRWLHRETAELLAQLKAAEYQLHAFSNYPIWYLTIESRLRLSDYLDWTFVSCRTGKRKPAREAFQDVIQQFSRPAHEFLFIDDCIANGEAARAIGMDSIHYTSLPALRDELAKRRLMCR